MTDLKIKKRLLLLFFLIILGGLSFLLTPAFVLATCDDPACTEFGGNSPCMNENTGTYHCEDREKVYHHLSRLGDSCSCDQGHSPPCVRFWANSWSLECGTCCFGGGGPGGDCTDPDQPNVSVSNITGTSATLNWLDIGWGDESGSGCSEGNPNNPFGCGGNRGWVGQIFRVGGGGGLTLVQTSLDYDPDGCFPGPTRNWGLIGLSPNTDYEYRIWSVNRCTCDKRRRGTFTTGPPPFCTVATLSPPGFSLDVEEDQPVVVSSLTGTADIRIDVARVDFSSTNPGIVSVSPSSDNTFPYETVATGVSPGGPANVLANVVLNVGGGCAGNSTVTVNAPGPWWQTTGGDVHAGGTINNSIPSSATEPYCSLLGGGGYPGIVSYGSETESPNLGDGSSSETDWLANSAMTNYSYNFFENHIKTTTTIPEGNLSILDRDALTTGFYLVEDGGGGGNLVLPDAPWNINPGTKIVILVPGDLTVNDNIGLLGSDSFLGFFVGGNINIDGSIAHQSNIVLEGAYFADGAISTGVNTGSQDSRLVAEGIFVAGGVSLGRDLGNDNDDTPAESFLYQPNLWLHSPQELWEADFTWQELAP